MSAGLAVSIHSTEARPFPPTANRRVPTAATPSPKRPVVMLAAMRVHARRSAAGKTNRQINLGRFGQIATFRTINSDFKSPQIYTHSPSLREISKISCLRPNNIIIQIFAKSEKFHYFKHKFSNLDISLHISYVFPPIFSQKVQIYYYIIRNANIFTNKK